MVERENLAFKQHLQGFDQIEWLPMGFAKEPLPDFAEATTLLGSHGMACSKSSKHV